MTRPCLACGGTIEADPARPGPGVLAHVRSERHLLWSRGERWLCPDCRMVTIPATRERCRGCARTREMVA